jgi:hypothetical protein
MSRSTSSRFARRSALATAALLIAVSGLAGCSSGGEGCPQSVLDLIAEQEGVGAAPHVVSASEFPVEELQGPLAGACIIASSTAPGSAGDFYLAVAAQGVSADTLADAATGAGFAWIDGGGEQPYGQYERTDPVTPVTEYMFVQEVDADFNETLSSDFEEGRVALSYQAAELIVD